MGLILADQKKIDEAENYYKKGIKINPNFALIYNNLASIYKYKQKYTYTHGKKREKQTKNGEFVEVVATSTLRPHKSEMDHKSNVMNQK